MCIGIVIFSLDIFPAPVAVPILINDVSPSSVATSSMTVDSFNLKFDNDTLLVNLPSIFCVVRFDSNSTLLFPAVKLSVGDISRQPFSRHNRYYVSGAIFLQANYVACNTTEIFYRQIAIFKQSSACIILMVKGGKDNSC